MMNLNDKEWKAFHIEEISKISSGRDIYDSERIIGTTPYVSSTSKNNGIGYFVGNHNFTFEKKCLSVNRNGSVGYSFYHPYQALFSNDCRKLELKHNSNFVGFFVSNQITMQKEKYNYGYKMGTERLKRQTILLPINNNKEPDYEYIKKYIKFKIDIKIDDYKKYSKKVLDNLTYKEIEVLDEKKWKEFFLTEIFDKIQRGKRLTKANQNSGNIPYISSTSLNNGIDNFIGNKTDVRVFSDCLTIANSGSVGASFYHPYECIGSDHITHFKKNGMSKYVYMFISTLTNRFSEKYNFNREINDARISREKIMLPMNDKLEPDYEYMEQYMKNLTYKKINQYLKYLESQEK